MRIYNEGNRRFSSNLNYKAKQNKTVKSGKLLVVGVTALLGSFAVFSDVIVTASVDGQSFTTNPAGGSTDTQILQDFKNWACNERSDPSLCDKYFDTETIDDIEIDDLIEYKESNNIEDAVNGSFSLFSSIDIRHIIEQRGAVSNFGLSVANVEFETEFSRFANSSINSYNNVGGAGFASGDFWENTDLQWQAPYGSSAPYLAKVHLGELTSSMLLESAIGLADYASTLFWDFADVVWSDVDTSTQSLFLSQVLERTTSADISLTMAAGQAGWASDIEWQALDVDWNTPIVGRILQRDVSPSVQLLTATSHVVVDLEKRNTSASLVVNTSVNATVFKDRFVSPSISLSADAEKKHTIIRDADSDIAFTMTAGSAGWESNLVWESTDILWERTSGQVTQGNASSNISVSTNSTSNYIRLRNASSSSSFDVTVGTAGWVSNLIWEQVDILWERTSGQVIEESATSDISLSSNVTPSVSVTHQRNASSSSTFTLTVGSAGWASDLIWEQADVEWHLTSGSVIQEDATSSISLSSNVTPNLSVTHQRNASSSTTITMTVGSAGWASNLIWEQADVEWHLTSGQLIQESATSQFSLGTNINSQLIAGWNSEATFVENLNRNWEAI